MLGNLLTCMWAWCICSYGEHPRETHLLEHWWCKHNDSTFLDKSWKTQCYLNYIKIIDQLTQNIHWDCCAVVAKQVRRFASIVSNCISSKICLKCLVSNRSNPTQCFHNPWNFCLQFMRIFNNAKKVHFLSLQLRNIGCGISTHSHREFSCCNTILFSRICGKYCQKKPGIHTHLDLVQQQKMLHY